MEYYDFEGFFVEFEKKLKDKINGHGQLSFKDYVKYISKFYNIEELKQFTYKSKHTGFNDTYEDILFYVFNKRYCMFKKRYNKSSIYKKLLVVYSELSNRKNLIQLEKVFLIDKCIDLQHNSGFIIDVDVEKLKIKFEENVEVCL